MINYILTKYYYYKYLWTIKKSIGSLNAIIKIESGTQDLRKAQKSAEHEVNRIRTDQLAHITAVTSLKGIQNGIKRPH